MGLFDSLKVKYKVKKLMKDLRQDENENVQRRAPEVLVEIGEPAVEPLIRELKDKKVRWGAVKALRNIGDVRAVEPLIRVLKDEDGFIRGYVAEALGTIGDERAVEPLIQALKDKEYDARRDSAEALGKIGEPAVEPLIRALKDTCGGVRWGAAKVLGEIGDARAIEPLVQAMKDEEYDVQRYAVEALVKVGDKRAIEPLTQALKDNVQKNVAEALEEMSWQPKDDTEKVYYLIAKNEWDELVKLGKTAVEPLIQTLKDNKDCEFREKAAEALGEIGDARAVEPLILALKDEEGYGQGYAAEALGKVGDARAVEPLIQYLKDEEGDGRGIAAGALGGIGDARAVEPLIQALKDGNHWLRGDVAEALGEIGDARAVEPLILALKDENECNRWNVAKALDKIGWKPNDIEKAYYLIARKKWDQLVKLGEAAVEPSIWLLGSNYEKTQDEAANVLEEIGDERAFEPLIQLSIKSASRHDGIDNIYANSALGEIRRKIGDERAFEPLIHTLNNKDMSVRREAAEAIDWVSWQITGSTRSSWQPKDDIEKSYYLIAKNEWDELVTLGKAAVEPLIHALNNWETPVRREAAEALGEIGDERAVEPLIHATKDEIFSSEEVQATAIKSLEKIGSYK